MVLRSKETRVRKIAGIFIFPGLNTFSNEESTKLEGHPNFNESVNLGQMEILEVDSVDESKLDTKDSGNESNVANLILNVNVEDAKELIKEILDVNVLEDIVSDDRRRSVKSAAKAQIKNLTEEKDELIS